MGTWVEYSVSADSEVFELSLDLVTAASDPDLYLKFKWTLEEDEVKKAIEGRVRLVRGDGFDGPWKLVPCSKDDTIACLELAEEAYMSIPWWAVTSVAAECGIGESDAAYRGWFDAWDEDGKADLSWLRKAVEEHYSK